jgi:hypothetical protein
MKKFNSLVNQVYSNILLEEPAPVAPAPAIDQTGGNAQPAAPAPAPIEQPTPEPVSSEGLRNLVDLIQRALSISPDSLDAVDKSIFNSEITIQNSLEKQKQLTDIVDRLNPADPNTGV